MAVKALYDYDFPSKDRQELFGDDMLVNVLWTNNMMFALGRLLPRAQGDVVGGLQVPDDRTPGPRRTPTTTRRRPGAGR